MPDNNVDVSTMDDDQLSAWAADLADQRTEIRLAQNRVQAEIDLRRALSSMSDETRRIVQVRFGGAATPEGEARA